MLVSAAMCPPLVMVYVCMFAGTDATGVFQDVGHSPDAIKTRDGYLIGYVSGEEPSESRYPQCMYIPAMCACVVTVSHLHSSCRVCGTHCNKLALAIGAVAIVGILLFAYKKYY